MSIEEEKEKDALWDNFDKAIVSLRYNNLPRIETIDLMEDAVSQVCRLATELGIDPMDFF